MNAFSDDLMLWMGFGRSFNDQGVEDWVSLINMLGNTHPLHSEGGEDV